MTIMFELADNEDKVTPLKIAEALVEAVGNLKDFPEDGLKEINAYLAVYNRFTAGRKG